MKLFRFELRKLWRQKKLLWLAFIVILIISATFIQNMSQQSTREERALEKIKPSVEMTNVLYQSLKELEREGEFGEGEIKQLEHVNGMANAFFQWTSAIYNEEWSDIPTYEYDFLTHLGQFEDYGGNFGILQGIERQQAIEKNGWMRTNQLAYEDEEYALSPALFIKENVTLLLSSAGLVLLLLLFGTTLTVEQEQRTWLTLNTQPIARWKQIVGKYCSVLVVILLFLSIVIVMSLLIPFAFGHQTMNFQYPQIVTAGDTFTIISTTHYLVRSVVLFMCASIFVFSVMFLVSTWVKSSFSALMVTGFILIVGFFSTDMSAPLQSALNPFYYFNFSQILEHAPRNTDWFYPLFAALWSSVLVCLAILLPAKEIGLFQSSDDRKPFYRGETRQQLHQIWTMTIFEWRKMRRQGLLKRLMILLPLLLIVGYFLIAQQVQQKETAYLEELQQRAEDYENGLLPWSEKYVAKFQRLAEESEDKFEASSYNDIAEEMKRSMELYRDTLAKNKAALVAYDRQEWLPFYDYQLQLNRFMNKEWQDPTVQSSGEWNPFSHFTLEASIAEKKWLMAYDIQPVFSGEFIPTIYHNWGERKKEQADWEQANRKIDHSGLFTLYIYFQNYVYFVLILLLLFLVGVGFAKERGKKATLRLLITQPTAKKDIFLGKVIHAVLTVLGSCMGLFGFVLLVGSTFNRFGDWNYPILHYNSKSLVESWSYAGMRSFEGGYHFIPLGDYLLDSVVLFLFVVWFFIVLAIFLSLFIPNQLGVMTVGLLVGTGGYIASSRLLADWAHLSPFTYLDIPKIINGEVSTLMNNPSINLLTGVLVLAASTLVVLVIGYVWLGRKNRK